MKKLINVTIETLITEVKKIIEGKHIETTMEQIFPFTEHSTKVNIYFLKVVDDTLDTKFVSKVKKNSWRIEGNIWGIYKGKD